jgi:hypothetical protein
MAERRGLPPTLYTPLPWSGGDMPLAKPDEPEELEELECVGETAGLNPVGINPVGLKPSGIIPGEKTGRPFSLLHVAERYKPEWESKVIVEQDGIHFINSEAFGHDPDREELNDGFKKLVESVVGKP